MGEGKYILKGHEAIEVDDLIEWAILFEKLDRRVACDINGDVKVSTVFLGLDHQFGDGPPLLFETMVFGGEHDQDMDRYSTWDEALDGHKQICKKVFNAELKD